VDNSAPALVSSVPADGQLVTTAGSLAIVADETLAGITGPEIDGAAAPPPVLAGPTATYTSVFSDGPHIFSGQLEDTAGNTSPILVHFTVWSLAAADYPWIEMNSFPSSAIELTAANGEGEINVPAGAWSGAPAGDWLVVRIDPRPAATIGNGFQTAGDIYDVTAHWAFDGAAVHNFTKALDLTIPGGTGTIVPATLESGAWRTIKPVPGGTSLPNGWVDGYYKSGSDVHILTKHLSSFSLLKDVRVPTKPGKFTGAKQNRHLILKWTAATDNSGVIGAYLVYANGSLVKTLGSSARSADMGRYKTSDARAFQVAARDAAGNVGPKTRGLVIVPRVTKLTLASARAKLTARGLRTGAVSYVYSTTVAAGLVVSARSGVVFKGSAVGLTVARGPAARIASTTPPPTTGGTTGYTGYGFPPSGTTSGGTTSGGTTSGVGNPTTPTTSGGAGGEDSLSPAAGSDASESPGEVEPQSYTPGDDGASPLRRLLGFALLGGAFAAAGAVALRARGPRLPRTAETTSAVEPLLFWDQRLLRAVTSSVRRVTGRF
jgi:hypothetical protein